MPKRSAQLRVEARFFFEPRQLGAEAANLGVQLAHLPFVLGFQGLFALAVLCEQLGQVLRRLALPLMDLVRMDPIFRRDLRDGLLFFQGLQDHRGLLASGETLSLGHGVSIKTP